MRITSRVDAVIVTTSLLMMFFVAASAQDSIRVDGMAIKLMDMYGGDLLNKQAGVIAGVSVDSQDANSVEVSVGVRSLGGEPALDLYGFLMGEAGKPVPEVYSTRAHITSIGDYSFSLSYNGADNPRSEELVVFLMAGSELVDSRSIQLQRGWGAGSADFGSASQDSDEDQDDREPVSSAPVEDVVIEPVAIAGTPTPEDENKTGNGDKPKPKFNNLILTIPAQYKLQSIPTKTQPGNTTKTTTPATKTQPNNTTTDKSRLNTRLYTQVLLQGVFLYPLAPKAIWRNGPQQLSINGAANDSRGFVRQEAKATLSDGKQYSNVLYTHPRWVDRGAIIGTYSNITIPKTAAAFRTGIGMMRGAATDNLFTFQAFYKPTSGNAVTLLRRTITYASGVQEIVFNLPAALKGSTGVLTLMVSANASSGRGWCVWVNPRFQ